MRKPVVEFPPELLDDRSLPLPLPLPERVDRRMTRDGLEWAAWQEAYGSVVELPFGMPVLPVEVDEPGWSTPGE